jgi:predicted dinucleotide-utilizing enzyme
MNVKKVGLIGCGAIGTVLAEAIERKLVDCRELVVYDVEPAKAQKLKSSIDFPCDHCWKH